MNTALLIGNGFSSQLIPEYKDENIAQCMRGDDNVRAIHTRYCTLFSTFCDCKSEVDITMQLDKLGFPNPPETYDIYFEKYNLKRYTKKSEILGVETLLKIGQMFSEICLVDVNDNVTIRDFACQYYWNVGLNGINGIKNPKFNREQFEAFLNTYEYVFTTNYDTILDDAYEKEVKHLHGSFLIEKDGCVRDNRDNCPDSLLIWGIDDAEKNQQIDEVSGLHKLNRGFRFNISKLNMVSALDGYFRSLCTGDFSRLDIVGYSGENDKHINRELVKNSTLNHINYFCSPDKIEDKKLERNISKMFDGKFSIKLVIWKDFWNHFMEEDA